MAASVVNHIIGSRVEITILVLYLLAVLYWRANIREYYWNRLAVVSTSISSIVAFTILLTGSITYLLYGSYLDHIEPSISVIAELLKRNQPLYHPLDTGNNAYSLLYGPLIFQVTAVFQHFIPSVLGSKLPAFIAFWGACIAILLSAKNICKNRTLTIAIYTLAGYVLISLGYHNYWNRPDPYLLLCTSLAVLAYLRLTPLGSAVVIGALAGIAAGFKVHAFLYITPIALSLVLLSENEHQRGKILLIGIGSSTLLFLAPFLDPNVSLTAYLDYLLNASKHGLVYPLFLSNMKLAVIITTPGLILLIVRRITLSDQIEAITLPFVISVFVTAVVSSKAGSGPHHLIPFIPISIILSLYLVSKFHNHALVGPAMFAAVALSMSSYGMKEANAVVKRATYAYSINPTITEKVYELRKIHSEYPKAEMGIGGIKENEDTFLRVELVLQGGNATVEFGPWMDLHFSGIPKKRLDPLTVDCKVPQWIIPKESDPFSLPNVFMKAGSKEKLVTNEFLASFASNYRQAYKGSFYDVWSCNIKK
ncbi:MAG: hypothetical protein ABW086_11065 [Sedimenticola sp.]